MGFGNAEKKRDQRIAWLDDLALLEELLKEESVIGEARCVFETRHREIRNGVRACLSRRERAWAEETARKFMPMRAEDAPRGKEVPTPEVLKNLPKKPPPRKRDE